MDWNQMIGLTLTRMKWPGTGLETKRQEMNQNKLIRLKQNRLEWNALD